MLLEMHCHTAEFSPCSKVAAVELVRQVQAKGLQGIVLTDHHHLWSDAELQILRRDAGVPDHFLLLSGQEVSTSDLGDVLVYGANASIDWGVTVKELRQLAPQAALVWAHPYRGGRSPIATDLVHPALDGVEIFNANQTASGNSQGLRDWHYYRFTALAGTDTHGASYAGIYPTHFEHPVATISELAMEIRSGRCRPFLKEIPRSGAHSTVTEVTIGVKGPDERRERLIIRQLSDEKRWQRAERGYQIMAAIAGQGFISGRYRVPQPITDDPVGHVIIEEGVRGKSLHDRLLTATLADGREYLDLAARWLARLHRLRLRITSPEEFIPREIMRLERYVGRFTEMRHRHTRKAQEIMERIALEERALLTKGDELLVQGHGDYHPKNILIGQDQLELRSTLFAAAIDFESSLLAPPAFDVGCFCMQFRNQFHGQPQILAAYSEATFIATYMAEYGAVAPDFLRQVELFAARSALGIAAYLIKLGLGTSEDVWRLLVEAERALTHV